MPTTFEINNVKIHFMDTDPVKVIVGTYGKDWLLKTHVVCPSAARYFYYKHVRHQEKPNWLERAKAHSQKLSPVSSVSKEAFRRWLQAKEYNSVGWLAGRYEETAIERYEKEMREAERWPKGGFEYDGSYHTTPRWIVRFKNFCRYYGGIAHEINGLYMRSIFEKERAWNTAKWDYISFDEEPCGMDEIEAIYGE